MSDVQIEKAVELKQLTQFQQNGSPDAFPSENAEVPIARQVNENSSTVDPRLFPTSEVHQSLKSLVESFEHVLSTGTEESAIKVHRKCVALPAQPKEVESSIVNKEFTDVTLPSAESNSEVNHNPIALEQQNEGSKPDLDEALSNLKIEEGKNLDTTGLTEINITLPQSGQATQNPNKESESEALQEETPKLSEKQSDVLVEIPQNDLTEDIQPQIVASASGTEIQEENIKNALKEIINEIDKVVESESDLEKVKLEPATTVSPNSSNLPTSELNLDIFSSTSLPNSLLLGTSFVGSSAPQVSIAGPKYQPWCSSESIATSVCNNVSNWYSSSPPSSSLPYFLTRPSRVVTPTPFAVPYEDPYGSLLITSGPVSTTSTSMTNFSSFKDNDETIRFREEKGMGVSNSDNGFSTTKVDLEKIFTPASDFESNYVPRRKMYGSSSFYGETHPTVEDQVKLARKISQSLTDSSNQKSKGQSMYVKRKKKSVKWIHEGPEGTFTGGDEESSVERSDSALRDSSQDVHKPLMKLVMNPSGTVKDWHTLKPSGMYNDHGALSPEICFDLVKDLHSPTGKGGQLFAKRKRRSEKWVVDETNVKRTENMPALGSNLGFSNKPYPTTPSSTAQFMPPPSFIDRSRIEHAQKLNEIQERFSKPKLRIVKSPWEVALETGSVEGAFEELQPPAVGSLIAAADHKLSQTISSIWTPESNVYMPTAPRAWESSNIGYSDQNPLPPSSYSQTVPTPSKGFPMLDFGTNYNTAPRGFCPGQSIYKPVLFSNIH